MTLDIKPYVTEMEAKVKEFNQRLRERKVTYQLPESHLDTWLPRIGNRKIYRDGYLAIDDDATVRGGIPSETPGVPSEGGSQEHRELPAPAFRGDDQ